MFNLMNQLKVWMFSMIMVLGMVSWTMANWISIWMTMEVSVLFMMGSMSIKNNYGTSSLMMKYFIIQLLISLVFMFVSLIYVMNLLVYMNMLCGSILLMKLGFFPFHFWSILVMGKLDWMVFYFLNTFMKMPPIYLMYYMLEMMNLTIVLASSMMFGSWLGLNNVSLQKLLGYSSLTHLCWLIYSLSLSFSMFWVYLIIYMINLLVLTLIMDSLSLFYVNQFKLCLFSKFYNFCILFCILSMAGFPPFMGFLMKWILGSFMVYFNLKMMIFILVVSSILSVMFYFQMFYYFILILSINIKFYFNYYLSNLSFMLLNFVLMFYFLIYFYL